MNKSLKSLIPVVGETMSKLALNPPKTTAGMEIAKLQIRAADKFAILSGQELQYERLAERLARTAATSKCSCAKGRVKVPGKYGKC